MFCWTHTVWKLVLIIGNIHKERNVYIQPFKKKKCLYLYSPLVYNASARVEYKPHRNKQIMYELLPIDTELLLKWFFFFPQASGNITGVMATSKDKDDCSTHDTRFFNNNKNGERKKYIYCGRRWLMLSWKISTSWCVNDLLNITRGVCVAMTTG